MKRFTTEQGRHTMTVDPRIEAIVDRGVRGELTESGVVLEFVRLAADLAQENDLLREAGARLKGVSREAFDEFFDGVLRRAKKRHRPGDVEPLT